MRLVTYQEKGRSRVGALLDNWVVDLQQAHHLSLIEVGSEGELATSDARIPTEMLALLAGGGSSMAAVRRALLFAQARLARDTKTANQDGIAYQLEEITLQPPLLRPGKLICVGLNYPLPGEKAPATSEYPVLFHKVGTTLTGHGQPIVIPRITQEVFIEGELAVVMGWRGKHITEAEALSYVAGYTIANDVGASDLEQRTSQWATGKLPDTFCPLGPALVTRDEVPDPQALAIRTTVNGQPAQNGSTGDMVFGVTHLIAYISALATLEPGDLILTGSPKPMDCVPAHKVFVQPGDRVSIRIDKLGELSNPIISEE